MGTAPSVRIASSRYRNANGNWVKVDAARARFASQPTAIPGAGLMIAWPQQLLEMRDRHEELLGA